MNCQRYGDAILDLARGLEAPDAQDARDHVETCAGCAAFLRQQRALTAGLRAVAEASPAGPSDGLEGRLIEVFRARRRETAPTAVRARRLPRWIQAAAVLAIAAGVAAWWKLPAGRDIPQGSAVARATHPGVPKGGQDSAVGSKPIPIATSPTGAEVSAPTADTSDSTRRTGGVERAAPFVALPAALSLPQFDSGEIVRVEIPVVSLPAYGVAIPPDAIANERIVADLLVGQDGWPRAIRLVARETEEPGSR